MLGSFHQRCENSGVKLSLLYVVVGFGWVGTSDLVFANGRFGGGGSGVFIGLRNGLEGFDFLFFLSLLVVLFGTSLFSLVVKFFFFF